jgi:hypothetical protein
MRGGGGLLQFPKKDDTKFNSILKKSEMIFQFISRSI